MAGGGGGGGGGSGWDRFLRLLDWTGQTAEPGRATADTTQLLAGLLPACLLTVR